MNDSENGSEAQDSPFFSILIPLYNRPQYIPECLDSIFENDFTDFEVVMSDDCSPGISQIERIVKPYLCHTNLRFIKQERNLGWSDNRNFLVRKAKGKFVILIGDDDKFLPFSFSRLKKNIEAHSGYDLYAFGYHLIDENSKLYGSRRSPEAFELNVHNEPFLRNLLLFDIIPFWTFHVFSICYDRRIGDEIGYLKEAFIGDDIAFLFDCMNAGKNLYVIPEVLFSWRKIKYKNKKNYQNLSSSSGSNIKARGHLLQMFQRRKDLNEFIYEVVSRPDFKHIFLFRSISFDTTINKARLSDLMEEDPELTDLLLDYLKHPHRFSRIRIRLSQVLRYLKLFGFKAIWVILLFAYEKFYNKFFKGIKKGSI